MIIDSESLIAGIIFGIIGFWLFRKGKKEHHVSHSLIGIGLMVYPYFTSDTPRLTWGVGFAFCGLAYLLKD